MQELIVFLIIAIAVGSLARRSWLVFKGRRGCGGCPSSSGCGSKHPVEAPFEV